MDFEVQPLVYVSGAVGGTGKSMVSMAAVDYIQHGLKQPVVLVETDTANPDVYKACANEVEHHHALDLDRRDGWIELLNVCDDHKEYWIVVNGGARNLAGVREYGLGTRSEPEHHRAGVPGAMGHRTGPRQRRTAGGVPRHNARWR